MILSFKIISDESESFILQIDSGVENSFFQRQQTIQKECRFERGRSAKFFTAGKEWDKIGEIPLITGKRSLSQERLNYSPFKPGDQLTKTGDNLLYA